jgi:hypothetical protein
MTYQDQNNLHCKTQYPTSIATDGQVIISLPKTAKADADECCKHHTWSHHFELQTSQLAYNHTVEKRTFSLWTSLFAQMLK